MSSQLRLDQPLECALVEEVGLLFIRCHARRELLQRQRHAHAPRSDWGAPSGRTPRSTSSAGEGLRASFRDFGAGEALGGPRYSAPSPWRRRSRWRFKVHSMVDFVGQQFLVTSRCERALFEIYRCAALQRTCAARSRAAMISKSSRCSKCALGVADELRNHRVRAEE